jgi:isopropylmalate/homocitrate/citramalate synthase
MSQGDAGGGKTSRAATVEDLKRLAAALEAAGVDYVLIGGFALNALGYQRATTDIDLLIQPTAEQGRRTIQALLTLPDRVALQIDPRWFDEGETAFNCRI